MSELRMVTLRDLVKSGHLEIGDGYRTKRSEHGTPGLPILRVAEVLDGRIEPEFTDFVSEQYRGVMGSKISRPGDVILTTKGTVGRVAIIPADSPEFVYSPQLCYFRTSNDKLLASRYLYYWFKGENFWAQARSVKSQTDMADYINLADIRALELSLPSRSAQDSIVDILGALDERIAVNSRIVGTVHSLLAAHYVARSQSAEIKLKLGELIELKYGKALKEEDRTHGPIPVFGGNGISGWHKVPLNGGPGVIIGRKGANAGSVSWSPGPFWPIDTAFYVEPRSGSIPLEFLYFLLEDAGLRNFVGDSAIPGLNREIALSLTVRIPSEETIRLFVETARPLLALNARIAEESRSIAELRDTLLPKLMSGEIRVRDAEKVVEDVT